MNISYIAGFFDGEGCISRRMKGDNPRVVVTIAQKSPTVLQEIRRHLGYGRINRVGYSEGRDYSYRLTIEGKENVSQFLLGVYPHLIVKRPRADIALQLLAISPSLGEQSRRDRERTRKRVELADKLLETSNA